MIRSIDLTYRGKEYRLAEPGRSAGTRVMPACDHRACVLCHRRLRAETMCVVFPDDSWPRCVPCAIQVGSLVPLTEGAP